MKKLTLTALGATLLAALAVPGLAPAQGGGSGIQRCEAPDGTAIYTDKACAAFGATATPIPGELLTRLASDTHAGPEAHGVFGNRRAPAIARRSAASGCARSTTQLSMDLQGAWALGDVNRIAESYHWVGLDTGQARSIMQRLGRLAGQPLWQAHYFDARIGGGVMQLADASGSTALGDAGVMQLVLGDDGSRQVQDFEVRRYHGCYFVHF
ncbi:hypothetical protein [Lysobacter sp. F6437]|uniref:hypothetical protein n=1 Tax=Lysobacter sp. F6437 TaxID=3459296 RepID=UPI00403DE5F4